MTPRRAPQHNLNTELGAALALVDRARPGPGPASYPPVPAGSDVAEALAGCCPTCGRPPDTRHLVSRAHALVALVAAGAPPELAEEMLALAESESVDPLPAEPGPLQVRTADRG